MCDILMRSEAVVPRQTQGMSDFINGTMPTSTWMPHPVYDRPLQFSDCHGCNVIVKSNRTLSQAVYLKAHGQFITQAPLMQNQPFNLIFEGKGIVKFNAFPHKSQAIDWVRSTQPLPQGCRRLRMNGLVQYTVSVPKPGRCVLMESVRQSGRELFTFEAGPTTTLSFDIECGDVKVHIDHLSSSLVFDTFCHSPHIKLERTHCRSTASLLHYNPSSLCCLEDSPLISGAVFRLEVHNSSCRTDSGSYFRVCVARQLNAYENNDQTVSCGSATHPSVRGRRLLIGHNSHEVLIIQILPDGLIMSRPNSGVIERLSFCVDETPDKTLWFEIHKISLRVWQVCERNRVDLDNSFTTSQLDLDDPPPSAPAPPPPRLPPRKPTVCPRSPGRNCNTARRKFHTDPLLAVRSNGGYASDASDGSTVNRTTLDKRFDSYVSMDNFKSCGSHNEETHPQRIYASSCPRSKRPVRQDPLCYNCMDSASFPSTGPYLMTFSSLESLNVNNDDSSLNHRNRKNSRRKPHYEHPNHIWERSTSSPSTPFLNSRHCQKTTDIIKSPRLYAGGSAERKVRSNSDRLNHNQCQTDNSVDDGGVAVVPRFKDQPNNSTTNNHFYDLDRNRRCEAWVAQVNDSRHIWSSHADVERNTQSQDGGSRTEFQRILTSEPYATCPRIPKERTKCMIQTDPVTDSVWLSMSHDQSVQHNLDIHIVPVQGRLKCRSYHSDVTDNLAGSGISLTECTNTQTDQSLNLTEHGNGSQDRTSTQTQNSNMSFESFIPFTYLSGIDLNINETTTKKIFCSTETLCESDSTFVNQDTTMKKKFCSIGSISESDSTFLNNETRPKSVDSGGFDVDGVDGNRNFRKSADPSDEITHLKHLAQLEDMEMTHSETESLRSPKDIACDTNIQPNKNIQPKPCSRQPFSQYDIAPSPVPLADPVSGLPRSCSQSDHGESKFNDAGEKSNRDVVESSHEAVSADIGSARANELSGIINLRNNGRNIAESVISNCDFAYVSVGPTVTLTDRKQPSNHSERTDYQGHSLVSASSLPFSDLCDNIMNKCDRETTLKKTFSSSTESLSDSVFTTSDHEKLSKSVNSEGFNVDEGIPRSVSVNSVDPSDEITYLKHPVQLEDTNITRVEIQATEYSTENAISRTLPPKPCPRKPCCQYSLARRVSPVRHPFTDLPRNMTESDKTKTQPALSEYNKSTYNGYNPNTRSDSKTGFQEGIATTNGNVLEDELGDQEIDASSLRNHWRNGRRNIVESIISNNAAVVDSSSDLVVSVSNELQPLERSATLKRNLDSSPLNKSFK